MFKTKELKKYIHKERCALPYTVFARCLFLFLELRELKLVLKK